MPPEPASVETESIRKARTAFRQQGGMLRMADALRAGVHRRTLYAMRDAGQVEALARGLFRLTDSLPLGSPDLVAVQSKVPHGVIYLQQSEKRLIGVVP